MKLVLRLLPLALLCGALPLPNLRAAELQFIRLLEGEHATKWKVCGTQKITLENGVVDTTSDRNGQSAILWYAGKKFADFTLRLEYKRGSQDSERNSGVFFRFEDPGNDLAKTDTGYAVEINLPTDTGGIFPYKTPQYPAPELTGRWNEMVLTVIGTRVSVAVNHQVVTEYEIAGPASGFIGLENSSGGPGVQFRNVLLKELPPPPPGPVQEPATLEEALLCHEWDFRSTFDNNKGFPTWFLPDGKVKRNRPNDRLIYTWKRTGPRSFTLNWTDKSTAMSFPDDSFLRFEGSGFDNTGHVVGERRGSIPPPNRILEKRGQKSGPEIFSFTPALATSPASSPPVTATPAAKQ